MLIVDYFSKYPEVCALGNKTAKCVISHFKTTFARHGIPDELVADNMPFACREMQDFAHDWGFEITNSSPLFPTSNGQSERMVGTVKQLMRKAKEEGSDPHLAFLQYRNAPISGLKYSPAQLLMSRMLKDKMPTANSLLIPMVVSGAHAELKVRQQKQKKYYDKGTRTLPEIGVGDGIRVQFGRTWIPAVVTGKHNAPRSFIVTTEEGRAYRRNRRFIRHTPVILPPTGDDIVIGTTQTP